MPIRAKYADKTTDGVTIDEAIATLQGEVVKCVKVLDLGDKDIDDMTSAEIANFVAGDYSIIKCTDGADGFIANYALDIKTDTQCELHLLDSEFDVLHKVILLKHGDTWSCSKSTTELASAEDVGTKLYYHELNITTSGNNHLVLMVITTSSNKFSVQGGPPVPTTSGNIINILSGSLESRFGYSANKIYSITQFTGSIGTSFTLASCTITSETVTPL